MSTGVEIRRYVSVAHMQSDVPVMAAAGWQLIAQSEASAGTRSDLVATGIGIAAIGLLLFLPLVLVGLLVLAAGFVMQRKEIVVTYRYTATA